MEFLLFLNAWSNRKLFLFHHDVLNFDVDYVDGHEKGMDSVEEIIEFFEYMKKQEETGN